VTRAAVARALIGIPALILALAACSSETLSPEAERGRQVFQSQCATCHNADPSQPGPVGPALKGSSRDLLEAKVLRRTYPPGYRPKRTTTVMPALPAVAGDLDALAAFLR
jgi:mono/diheme cytochrome c family protein